MQKDSVVHCGGPCTHGRAIAIMNACMQIKCTEKGIYVIMLCSMFTTVSNTASNRRQVNKKCPVGHVGYMV